MLCTSANRIFRLSVSSEHKQLIEAFQALAETSKDPPPAETIEQRRAAIRDFGIARDKVVAQLQQILKVEWNRVKRGDVR